MVARGKYRVELEGKWTWLQKDNLRDSCSDVTVLYLHCINASMLVVILHYCFPRCYFWEKLNKAYTGSLLFPKSGCESVIISK